MHLLLMAYAFANYIPKQLVKQIKLLNTITRVTKV